MEAVEEVSRAKAQSFARETFLNRLLLRGAGRVVDYKRRLQRRVLSSEEVDANCLSLEGSHIEGSQHVSG